jgi:A/G-specific adenine glycosylase
MPWKEIRDPYKIWLSEIILQQTRVEQGLSYYNNFITHFPTVKDLANAADEQVFKLWEGLGYYSRCRNLLATARYITNELYGIFPSDHKGLLALKGVGPYTAAAIGSFAFNLPLAVLDGNVFRVLARCFGMDTPIDSTQGKIQFKELAAQLLDNENPALHNQAIMDLGAVVCSPRKPDCPNCPLQAICQANANGSWDKFPVKHQKIQVKQRFLYYLILDYKGERMVRERIGKDIWQHLFEFILKETDEPVAPEELLSMDFWGLPVLNVAWGSVQLTDELRHVLTHQRIHSRLLMVKVDKKLQIAGYTWKKPDELKKLPFPRLINRFLEIL